MSTYLASRLGSARHLYFVGRSAEQGLFQTALAQPDLAFQIIYVFGPGGIGKSTLLREYTHLCDQHRIPALHLDMRHIEPTPEAFSAMLGRAMGLEAGHSPFEAMAASGARFVLFIDTYELAAPLDEWLREVFLPQVPQNTLVVLASRQPPATGWRSDPGWQTLVHTLPLRNLSPDESRAYLTQRQVPHAQHTAILGFTHGHPLALSLVADEFAQRGSFQFQPEETPGVIKTLVERLVQKLPSPNHRAALEVCALVRLTTESLLAAVLGDQDTAHSMFEWLRGLSFIEARREGIFPHDLAREALITDLRWRNHEWYTELHRRARTYYAARLSQVGTPEQQRTLFDYVYLHRDNPVVRPYFDWQIGGALLQDVMRPDDFAALKAMVAQHEGEESARLASYWLSRHPQAVTLWRNPEGQPAGFLMALPLHQVAEDAMSIDPAVGTVWKYLRTHAPLRPGEIATLFRFWMARDEYQGVSSIQSAIFIQCVRHYLITPNLAYTVLPCADPDFWAAVFAYADLTRIPSADFSVGGRSFGVYGHDWRTVPPAAWLALLAEREIEAGIEIVPPPVSERLVVLSQAEFIDAVRHALRDLTQADLLRSNPLLHSRLVTVRVGIRAKETERIAALQTALREVLAVLERTPRLSKAYRALYHTYVQPAPTQEQAAEVVDMPFSTYRRHLKTAVNWVIDMLWRIEIGSTEQ